MFFRKNKFWLYSDFDADVMAKMAFFFWIWGSKILGEAFKPAGIFASCASQEPHINQVWNAETSTLIFYGIGAMHNLHNLQSNNHGL